MKEEILKFFKGEAADDEATLFSYSHDASLLEVMPKLVVFPKDTEDVKNLVKWVGENKDNYPGLSITARCAGTDMSGGAIGESIIMDFTRYMNKLIGGPLPMATHDEWEISVQPGMFYRDFEKITLEKSLILPCYTASKSLNAMGGMYGNNSAGERTLKYGKTEDYVLRAKVVLEDGNEHIIEPLNKSELNKKLALGGKIGDVYRRISKLIEENEDELRHAKPKVHKNSSGYTIWNVIPKQGEGILPSKSEVSTYFDLNKLLVGSQGTLGIVTEITFKVVPIPKNSKLTAIFINDLSILGRLVDEILELDPETVEAYDDKTMRLAVKFFPDLVRNKGFFGMLNLFRNFWPEFKMLLTNGFPKMIILVEFSGINKTALDQKCFDLEAKIRHFNLKVHVTRDSAEAEKYWDIRRESFALLRKHVRGMRTAPFIDDIIVEPKYLPKFLPELNQILGKYNLIYTIAGHAGDGNFHIIPLMDFNRPDCGQVILALGEEVYDLVVRYHGSITAEHNDGLIRTPYLTKMYNPKVGRIFQEIKNIFDPKNIFNPGKKVPMVVTGRASSPGTKEYIAEHLAIEHEAHHKV